MAAVREVLFLFSSSTHICRVLNDVNELDCAKLHLRLQFRAAFDNDNL